MFYTYAHTKPDGTTFYVGKGQGRRAWDVNHRNKHWKATVKKHGIPNVEIMANWEKENDALEHEKVWIALYRLVNSNMANYADGGQGCSGYKYTKQQRKNRSGAGNGMFGKKRSEKELNIISEQTRKKMAEKGHTHKITVCGNEFNSKRELARFLCVNHKTIQTWIKLNILEDKYLANLS